MPQPDHPGTDDPFDWLLFFNKLELYGQQEAAAARWVEDSIMICQDCHEAKTDVRIVNCPYADEIDDEIIEIQVCDDCYGERLADI